MFKGMKGRLTRFLYRVMARFPLPSQTKWEGSTELLALIPQVGLEDAAHDREIVEDVLGRVMHESGKRWMSERAQWVANSAAPDGAVTDMLAVTFKTLNMPTTIETRMVAGETLLETTTHFCPFIQNARPGVAVTRRICWRMCSDGRSLFTGITGGLPMRVHYEAPQKMGWGDSQCTKVIRLLKRPASADGRAAAAHWLTSAPSTPLRTGSRRAVATQRPTTVAKR